MSTTIATDLIEPVRKSISAAGVTSYGGLTKREWMAGEILKGLLRDEDNISGLSNSQITAIVIARTDAEIAALGSSADELINPPPELRMGNLPQTGLTKSEETTTGMLSSFQADNLNIDALDPAPTAPTATLAAATPGNVEHITISGAPTADLAGTPAAGNVDSLVVPTAPTAALEAATPGSMDHITVPIAPTMALGGSTPGNVDHITVPTAPTAALAGAGAGNVDDGDHYYVMTYVTSDGETSIGAIQVAAVTVADHTTNGKVTVTIPVSPFVGVTDRNLYRSKIAGAHAAYTDFWLVAAIGNNTDPTYEDNTAESGLGANPPAANDAAQYEYCVTYVTADGETTMGAVSAAGVTIADKAVDGQVTVTIPVSPFGGVTARNIYRCKAGTVSTSSVRTDYFYVGQVADNTTTTFVDNVAESGVGAEPPAASDAAGYKYVVTYTTGDGGESTIGAIQAAKETVVDNSVGGKITVTIPTSAEAGVTGRKVYRCKAGMTTTSTLRTHFFLVATVANNADTTILDNMDEATAIAAANPPAANTAGGHKYVITYTTLDGETIMGTLSAQVLVLDKSVNGQVELTAIPVSAQPGVTARKVYRSKAGVAATLRTHFFLVGTIANNTATTYTDNVADSALGASPPAANDAGSYSYKVTSLSASGESNASAASTAADVADKTVGGKIDLTSIYTGPVGTLSRKIYRTKCGYGSVGPWYYHSTVALNVITIATDNLADSGLGTATAPATETAWEGQLAVDAIAKKDAQVAELGITETDPVNPFTVEIGSAGQVTIGGKTKKEHFANAAYEGYISDSVNITAIGTPADIAVQSSALADALIVALNA